MGKQWKQCQTLFFWAPKSLQMVTAAMKLKDAYSLGGKLYLIVTRPQEQRLCAMNTGVHMSLSILVSLVCMPSSVPGLCFGTGVTSVPCARPLLQHWRDVGKVSVLLSNEAQSCPWKPAVIF